MKTCNNCSERQSPMAYYDETGYGVKCCLRSISIPLHFICKRYKKRFVSLHNQDRKLYFFPNTDPDSIDIPNDFRVCSDVSDFRIKTVKGGFQRRPELISSRDVIHTSSISSAPFRPKMCRKTERTKRIQQELVEMALKLSGSVGIKTRLRSNAAFAVYKRRSSSVDGECDQNKNTALVLDIGCGDGYSTVPLTDLGFTCVGVDLDFLSLSEYKIGCLEGKMRLTTSAKRDERKFSTDSSGGSPIVSLADKNNISNLQSCYYTSKSLVTVQKISPAADVVRWDLRHGLPFKADTFDLAISISFLQWLFYGERHKQLDLFFSSLKYVLCSSGKAVIQFYPRNANQLKNAVESASRHFKGILVGDYPHIDRGRKLFMVLFS